MERRGKYIVIGEDVSMGSNVVIGHHVVIHDGTIIGDNVYIHDHAVIGKLPMKAKRSTTTSIDPGLPPSVIGEGCIIGTGSIIYRGAELMRDVFVADLATIRENVAIGEETIIGRGVSVENNCSIGGRCKLETGSYLCAYSTLEDDVFIAPYVVTTNDNSLARGKDRFRSLKGVWVKRGGRVGAGAVMLPGKVVHEEGAAAAGSVVTRDIEGKTFVAGVPARFLREVPQEQWLERPSSGEQE